MRIHPVILCGGAGARLWPSSRADRPKPFLPLFGERSLFQETVLRMQNLAGNQRPLIVAGRSHVDLIDRQLSELGAVGTIMIEPEGRDSGPALAAAAAWIAALDEQAIIAMVASDHYVPDASAFRRAVETASSAASAGAIITFGVTPSEPSSAYGYIAPGAAVKHIPQIRKVDSFVEKPKADAAQAYVDAGYLWNSGNFVFGARVLLDELALHAPELAAAASRAVVESETRDLRVDLGDSFRSAPKISIDYAVMEKTDRAAVLPVAFAWSDVGAWEAVWAASVRDEAGNSVEGDVLLVDSCDTLVRGVDRLVVGVGLNKIAVIAESDALLVCDLASSQGVKVAVDRLKSLGRPEVSGANREPRSVLSQLKVRFGRWLFANALPLWWTLGADHSNGGFREALDHETQPIVGPLRARVQARQTYAYAVAGALGWNGPWRQAVDHGLTCLSDCYRRPDGLYRTLVAQDGAILNDAAMAYDQAFVLLALAHAAKMLPNRAEALEREAESVLTALQVANRHEGGGFREEAGEPFQADPQMHLFEAALAWSETGRLPIWQQLANAQAELGLACLIDERCGVVKENFASDWSPAPGREGRLIEPGHQFEWAWLLERWGRKQSREDARAAAQALFAAGERGVESRSGAVLDELLDDFSVADGRARLWPQTERLKAALIMGDHDPAYLPAAVQAGEVLMRYFDGLQPGLWRDKLLPDGSFVDEPAPASSFYHIVCAYAELAARY